MVDIIGDYAASGSVPVGDDIGPVCELGYPTTAWGKVKVARRVLARLPRPCRNDGLSIVYRVSDDVPEDITVALSYLDAALEMVTAGNEGVAVVNKTTEGGE